MVSFPRQSTPRCYAIALFFAGLSVFAVRNFQLIRSLPKIDDEVDAAVGRRPEARRSKTLLFDEIARNVSSKAVILLPRPPAEDTSSSNAAAPGVMTFDDPNKTVFECGWGNGNLSRHLFPDYIQGGRLDESPHQPITVESILVQGNGGPCKGGPYHPSTFPGRVLCINGEGGDMFYRQPYHRGSDRAVVRGAFGFATLISRYSGRSWDAVFRHEKKAVNTEERFLLYLASRCFEHREEAFRRLSQNGSTPAYYGGRCNGMEPRKRKRWRYKNTIQAPANEVAKRASGAANVTPGWRDNYLTFRKYRFCLVMENKESEGYITEKIINGFLSGCVPIYWGTREVFEVFNERSFIYYDTSNPEIAEERVAYLEKNRSAYKEVLREKILARGDLTMEQYFSYTDSVGNGMLKGQIRALLGLSP